MAKRVVGLDLGSSSVKAAEVEHNDDGTFVVVHQASRPMPRGAIVDGRIIEDERVRVASIISSMFAEEKFSTKDVIFGLNSSASVFMDEMIVPMVTEEDRVRAMPEIIAARQGINGVTSDDNEIAWSLVGEVDQGEGPRLKILVYRVGADYAKETAEVVEKAGLNIVGADLNAMAALRAIAIQDRPERQVDAIVDIGANVVTLILHRNGVPMFLTLDAEQAGNSATSRIAENLGTDDEAKAEYEKINDDSPLGVVAQARAEYAKYLAKSVSTAFASQVSRSDEIDSIAMLTLVGGGALLTGLGQPLRMELGGSVPFTYAQIDSRITSGLKNDAGDPVKIKRQEPNSGGDYLVAIGLGTGATL